MLAGKVLFVSGASRGIGLAIAKRAAQDGASVVIAAKTTEPHPKLPGTIYTAAKEIEEAGGKALPLVCDIRDENQVEQCIKKAADHFGGIDILINNASAIWPRLTRDTTVKRFDLMNQINYRGTWLCSKFAEPYLIQSAKQGRNPHILNLSPPLNMDPKWFKNHTAYSIAKYNMSLCAFGMAEEFRVHGIGVNCLWPRTAIATAAIEFIMGEEANAGCRTPEIMADAAYVILTRPGKEYTGNFCVDDSVLAETGVADFGKYACIKGTPDSEMILDFFLENDGPTKMVSSKL